MNKKELIKGLFHDVLGIAGFGSVCYGLFLVAPELCYIVAGGLVLIYAIKASRTQKADRG